MGDILLMRRLVSVEGLEAALARQRREGGRLGECVVALGLVTPEQMAAVLNETPAAPFSVAQTGVSRAGLFALMLKFMRAESCETLQQLSSRIKLPFAVMRELMDEAIQQRLVQSIGVIQQGPVAQERYVLSDAGKTAAVEALMQTHYLGPAPVSIAAFQAQVAKQAITNENLSESTLRAGFKGLSVPDNFVRKLLPAVRSGRTVLLYGPPGNGKTSVGTRIARLFRDVVYIPYAIEVAGQIIKMYDSGVHKPFMDDESAPALSGFDSVLAESFDARWVASQRPVAIAGGELTLEMLDLGYDPITKYYDAPLHMKALNGLFLIDDFGRQKVHPTQLLNRWIVPLESRKDYLKLNSGATFMIPFDELVLFSTNLEPADLMDPAFLRRIPYKLEVLGPTVDDYKRIFTIAAQSRGLTAGDEVLDHIVKRLHGNGHDLAYFQPQFLCDQVLQLCRCFELPPAISTDLADEALHNLYVDLKP
jgi:hypothetical protein